MPFSNIADRVPIFCRLQSKTKLSIRQLKARDGLTRVSSTSDATSDKTSYQMIEEMGNSAVRRPNHCPQPLATTMQLRCLLSRAPKARDFSCLWYLRQGPGDRGGAASLITKGWVQTLSQNKGKYRNHYFQSTNNTLCVKYWHTIWCAILNCNYYSLK